MKPQLLKCQQYHKSAGKKPSVKYFSGLRRLLLPTSTEALKTVIVNKEKYTLRRCFACFLTSMCTSVVYVCVQNWTLTPCAEFPSPVSSNAYRKRLPLLEAWDELGKGSCKMG